MEIDRSLEPKQKNRNVNYGPDLAQKVDETLNKSEGTQPSRAAELAKFKCKEAAEVEVDITLARMLIQGVVRLLQNRFQANEGPLPLSNLEDEFMAMWKVPLNLKRAGEGDLVHFLTKWPDKVEIMHDGAQHLMQLHPSEQKRAPKEKQHSKTVESSRAPAGGTPGKTHGWTASEWSRWYAGEWDA